VRTSLLASLLYPLPIYPLPIFLALPPPYLAVRTSLLASLLYPLPISLSLYNPTCLSHPISPLMSLPPYLSLNPFTTNTPTLSLTLCLSCWCVCVCLRFVCVWRERGATGASVSGGTGLSWLPAFVLKFPLKTHLVSLNEGDRELAKPGPPHLPHSLSLFLFLSLSLALALSLRERERGCVCVCVCVCMGAGLWRGVCDGW
jgi:hypothetical protein